MRGGCKKRKGEMRKEGEEEMEGQNRRKCGMVELDMMQQNHQLRRLKINYLDKTLPHLRSYYALCKSLPHLTQVLLTTCMHGS